MSVENESSDSDLPPFVMASKEYQEPKEAYESSVLKIAESQRQKFIESCPRGEGVTHQVSRCNLFESVVKLYTSKSDTILNEHPFRVQFEGEMAIDTGGVSRDMFSAFFHECYEKYFDGSTILTPVINPHVTRSELSLLGLVMSHAYMSTGLLPTRISFPCLANMMLPKPGELPEHVMVEAFVNSLSLYDASVVRQGLKESGSSSLTFSTELEKSLVTILSGFGCRELPRPQNFERLLMDITTHHFVRKPAAMIADIHSGIPSQHMRFWEKMSSGMLYDIYRAMLANNAKVLSMIAGVQPTNSNEERVLGYLRQFIGNLRTDELFAFLRFVTGSQVYTINPITVTFNSQDGLSRRPIAHTCALTLELSTSYMTYTEFEEEFSSILKNKDLLWLMNAI